MMGMLPVGSEQPSDDQAPPKGLPMLINRVACQEGKKRADIDVSAISDHVVQSCTLVRVAPRNATDDELATVLRHGAAVVPYALVDATCLPYRQFKRVGWQ